MFLKSLKLQNIRSYVSESIEFPLGSVLLSGDIGSGKSTLLLAIEFALFGLKTGELSGNMLLRHGSKEGFVELTFSIDGREVCVRRTLKRVKDRIGQGPGYLIEEGVKSDLMPKEIKARILDLFSYPKSVLSKNQDLIYRYTVYTPQEHMKRILYEDKDTRLDTLRHVFNIDKYKRIRDNAFIYLRSIKEKRNRYEGKIEGLEQKKQQQKELKDTLAQLEEKKKTAETTLIESKRKTQSEAEKILLLEKKVKKSQEVRKSIELLDVELAAVLEKRKSDKQEIDSLQDTILLLKDQLKDFSDNSDERGLFEDKSRRMETTEKELQHAREQKAQLLGKVMHLKEEAGKVESLDHCPLCQQQVPHDHKQSIANKTNRSIEELTESQEKHTQKEHELLNHADSLRAELKALQEKISQRQALLVKKEHLLESEKKLALLRSGFEQSRVQVASINTKKLDLQKEVVDTANLEENYERARAQHQSLLEQERQCELQHNSLVKEVEGITRQSSILDQEIGEKQEVQKELKNIVSLQNFLQSKFIPLVGTIEKHVFVSVYSEFNELFKHWLGIMLEDEHISARLDDTFSVVIDQNGYDTTLDNLSGGEKNSVALAYRLALNHVINDVMSQIKTSDLLILDEPTEGFSTDQLDRVRSVLEQLHIKQTIIVSHEIKVESFVDSVITVGKNDGVSRLG